MKVNMNMFKVTVLTTTILASAVFFGGCVADNNSEFASVEASISVCTAACLDKEAACKRDCKDILVNPCGDSLCRLHDYEQSKLYDACTDRCWKNGNYCLEKCFGSSAPDPGDDDPIQDKTPG